MSKKLREEIRRVLKDWDESRLTCQAVQHWARATSTKDADAYAELVLTHLRSLGEYLITCDDIPTYLKGLAMEPAAGVRLLEATGAGLDVKRRATDLRDDPFYGPHTRAILRELT
ncbi:MAG: hypothetical protein IT463_02285 [Planctomycetes bacterium]|nr:hypothetical protein [Planctomycetota bacterium]